MAKFSTRCVIVFLLALLFFSIFQYNLLFTSFHWQKRHRMLSASSSSSPRNLHLPKALIIGVRKGGTRALLDALDLHPNVRIVRHETHFFDSNYSLGVEWYRQQMPPLIDDQILIEKTPAYFTSELAPKRVFHIDPNMKLILIVRHPVYRTISDFTQVFYNKLEQNKSLPILSLEAFRRNDQGQEVINMDYKPMTNSLYHRHIKNWLKYFKLNQFLIVNGDVFRANPLNELRKLEKFLNLEQKINSSQLVFDYKKGFFCFKKTAKIRCLGQSKGRKHRQIGNRVVEKLKKSFENPNLQFFKLINRTFLWD